MANQNDIRRVMINGNKMPLLYTPEKFSEDMLKNPYLAIINFVKAFNLYYHTMKNQIGTRCTFTLFIPPFKIDQTFTGQTMKEAIKKAAYYTHRKYTKNIV